jgi:hypothetical protein
MLAELAAANAAFAVIKGALANGKDLSDLGSRVFDYFDNKAKIQQKVTEKGNRSDIEEFFALEKLNAQEVELRERMIYAGRPGMWGDWQKYQAAAARRRREEKEAALKAIRLRKAKMDQLIEYLVIGVASLILAGLMVYGIIIYMLHIRK